MVQFCFVVLNIVEITDDTSTFILFQYSIEHTCELSSLFALLFIASTAFIASCQQLLYKAK